MSIFKYFKLKQGLCSKHKENTLSKERILWTPFIHPTLLSEEESRLFRHKGGTPRERSKILLINIGFQFIANGVLVE